MCLYTFEYLNRIKYGWLNLGNDFNLQLAVYVFCSTLFGNFILKVKQITQTQRARANIYDIILPLNRITTLQYAGPSSLSVYICTV